MEKTRFTKQLSADELQQIREDRQDPKKRFEEVFKVLESFANNYNAKLSQDTVFVIKNMAGLALSKIIGRKYNRSENSFALFLAKKIFKAASTWKSKEDLNAFQLKIRDLKRELTEPGSITRDGDLSKLALVEEFLEANNTVQATEASQEDKYRMAEQISKELLKTLRTKAAKHGLEVNSAAVQSLTLTAPYFAIQREQEGDLLEFLRDAIDSANKKEAVQQLLKELQQMYFHMKRPATTPSALLKSFQQYSSGETKTNGNRLATEGKVLKFAPGTNNKHYTFEYTEKYLQMEEDELKRLVSEGEIRAFRNNDRMTFKVTDIEALKKGQETTPTEILPPSRQDADEASDESSDIEVLLVEEETSETLLDEDYFDIMGGDNKVPTIDFSEYNDNPETHAVEIRIDPDMRNAIERRKREQRDDSLNYEDIQAEMQRIDEQEAKEKAAQQKNGNILQDTGKSKEKKGFLAGALGLMGFNHKSSKKEQVMPKRTMASIPQQKRKTKSDKVVRVRKLDRVELEEMEAMRNQWDRAGIITFGKAPSHATYSKFPQAVCQVVPVGEVSDITNVKINNFSQINPKQTAKGSADSLRTQKLSNRVRIQRADTNKQEISSPETEEALKLLKSGNAINSQYAFAIEAKGKRSDNVSSTHMQLAYSPSGEIGIRSASLANGLEVEVSEIVDNKFKLKEIIDLPEKEKGKTNDFYPVKDGQMVSIGCESFIFIKPPVGPFTVHHLSFHEDGSLESYQIHIRDKKKSKEPDEDKRAQTLELGHGTANQEFTDLLGDTLRAITKDAVEKALNFGPSNTAKVILGFLRQKLTGY